jgi:hypothetical protein
MTADQLSAVVQHCRKLGSRLGADRANFDSKGALRALVKLKFNSARASKQHARFLGSKRASKPRHHSSPPAGPWLGRFAPASALATPPAEGSSSGSSALVAGLASVSRSDVGISPEPPVRSFCLRL